MRDYAQTGAEPRQANVINSANNQLREMTQQLEDVTSLLRNAVDDMLGNEASKLTESGPRPVPNCTEGHINTLQEAVTRINAQVSRLYRNQ